MANWLEKILPPPAKNGGKGRLPVKSGDANKLPAAPWKGSGQAPQSLPNATIIYGIGASLMFVAAFYLMISGRWFTGFVVFAVGGCLTGFALHLLKHQD